jgi:hypothetical protein
MICLATGCVSARRDGRYSSFLSIGEGANVSDRLQSPACAIIQAPATRSSSLQPGLQHVSLFLTPSMASDSTEAIFPYRNAPVSMLSADHFSIIATFLEDHDIRAARRADRDFLAANCISS